MQQAAYLAIEPALIEIRPQGHTQNSMLTTCFNQYRFDRIHTEAIASR